MVPTGQELKPATVDDYAVPATPVKRTLFRKYFTALFVTVLVPLFAAAAIEAWFGYRDQRARLDELLNVEAEAAASKIEGFLDGIREQMGWVDQLPWASGRAERHRLDAIRLLRLIPAISDITLLDGNGIERFYVSRTGMDRVGNGADWSDAPAYRGARAARVWFGPVSYYRDTEPHITIAISSKGTASGVAVAEINLKHIWDVISTIHVGEAGKAFVLDRPG